jgi:histidine triad (HIT) family protein
MMGENCFICNKHKGTITTAGVTIYEDDFIYVGHIDQDGKPNYLGHMMIDLKRHVPVERTEPVFRGKRVPR